MKHKMNNKIIKNNINKNSFQQNSILCGRINNKYFLKNIINYSGNLKNALI